MPIESAADRAVFVNGADFGETILWTVGEADPIAISVLGQAGALMIETQDGPDIQGQEATVTMVEADIPAGADQGDGAVFRARHYLVKSIEPDGTGMAIVRLEDAFA